MMMPDPFDMPKEVGKRFLRAITNLNGNHGVALEYAPILEVTRVDIEINIRTGETRKTEQQTMAIMMNLARQIHLN